ncbi:hypothetical protein UY3_12669 [Chelonia mydas]|uniref:Uncharacterized protein n=1 Tax=Chelonia mydas TaxID=8469 RepID=M7B3X2_CHEMY|nr:hypothetical protein UY3_12669 [Chelonia mydas]
MERFLGFVKQIRRSRRRKGKKYRPEEDYHEGYEDVYYYASEHFRTSIVTATNQNTVGSGETDKYHISFTLLLPRRMLSSRKAWLFVSMFAYFTLVVALPVCVLVSLAQQDRSAEETLSCCARRLNCLLQVYHNVRTVFLGLNHTAIGLDHPLGPPEPASTGPKVPGSDQSEMCSFRVYGCHQNTQGKMAAVLLPPFPRDESPLSQDSYFHRYMPLLSPLFSVGAPPLEEEEDDDDDFPSISISVQGSLMHPYTDPPHPEGAGKMFWGLITPLRKNPGCRPLSCRDLYGHIGIPGRFIVSSSLRPQLSPIEMIERPKQGRI